MSPPTGWPLKNYVIVVTWQDGRRTHVAESDSSIDLKGAPMVSRNPRSIKRIEIWDRTGCLETVWDASWSENT